MKRVHFVFTCSILISTLLAGSQSQASADGPNFSNPVNYPSGGQEPTQIVVADVNGDGKPDLVVANDCVTISTCSTTEGSVGVLLGNGNGTFQTAVVYDSGGAQAISVAVADVNGDGHPDVIVTNHCASASSCASSTVAVLLNQGDGTFGSAVTYNSGGIGAESVFVADLTGNGKLDLVVSNTCINAAACENESGDGSLGVLLGNGDGTFQTAVAYDSGGLSPTSIAIGDVNGDGKPDVVVAQCSGFYLGAICEGEVGVLLGNGNGTLQAAVNYSSDGDTTNAVALADLNGDGNLDILATNGSTANGNYGGSVAVLLGNGNGTFQTAVTYDLGLDELGASGIAVADVNGDGVPDVVTTVPSIVAVFLGVGNGTLAPAISFFGGIPGTSPAWVAAADVNGDGKPDLMVTTQYIGSPAGSVSVLLNTVVALSPGYMTFGNHAPGTTSYSLKATLTNTGSTTVDISSIAITGANANEFSQTNTCGTSVPAGKNCTISVVFKPTAFGNAGATLDVSYNVPGGPQTVLLFGTGSGPAVNLSPSSLSFPSQLVGTTSRPQIVTLTNGGNNTLTIASVTANPTDFSVVNGCSSSVAAGASCSIGVSFDPTQSGTRSGTLTVTDNASGSPQTVSLTGIGQGFLMTSSPSTATVSPGQTANYSISISPTGGFAQKVTLTCTGAPTGATCTVPASVTLNGSSPTMVNVKVATSASMASLLHPNRISLDPLALWWILPGLSGLVLARSGGRRRGKQVSQVLGRFAYLCLILLAINLVSCGGGSNSGNGTPYNLTVTGTYVSGSTTLTNSTKLILVVQ
jgi:FG-GAP-like repeat/Abnormal spindle-like microcephaly-assoc'd, ASPM-SPD-2-Hydin